MMIELSYKELQFLRGVVYDVLREHEKSRLLCSPYEDLQWYYDELEELLSLRDKLICALGEK